MNVKRYEWVACDEHACHCDVVESAEGDMVDYEDYAALEARCAALAAENALLKKSEPAPFSKLMMEALDVYQVGADEVPELAMLSAYKKLRDGLKTTATDAFLAEVRVQAHKEGAHFVANRMLAAWEAGFIDDTARNAADIARMILTSTEFMDDASEGDFARSFADGVLEDIAVQLRKEAAQ
ncbi:ead/Ea22-like family protein [Enterobacter hormaechei]|nr:ead/Ea22-like family protein [Enterobacter hormaechei]HCR1883530.1 ead/Ea22-like family protein [Enterobacter hormaechei subsp. steigerwaltii]HCD6001657.1 ead/Ea22-like family protein [Enterobacter hormaechei]HCD6610006.1 ead/Ea22-like family protein [Enterobacter hormaechei]HCR1092923.1 ead/Ea22-like family protein [Enterobacter hormaechei]